MSAHRRCVFLLPFCFLALFVSTAHSQQLSVIIRVVEMPYATATALLADPAAGGNAIHTRALMLAEVGEAEIVDTHVITMHSGRRSTIHSIAEVIYPSIYDHPGVLPGMFGEVGFERAPSIRPTQMYAFETRNVGISLSVEPTVKADGWIDLRFVLDDVKRAGFTTLHEYADTWGDASVRMPIFETHRTTTSTLLLDGTYQLATIHNPTPDATLEAATRRLVFVGVHVLQNPIP